MCCILGLVLICKFEYMLVYSKLPTGKTEQQVITVNMTTFQNFVR